MPDNFGGGTTGALGNVGCAEFELIPPEIISYLNLNRSSFPELPFKMRVEVSVYGIGTAGDEYTSNPIDVPIEVVQDNIIAPSPADDGSDSTGTTEASEIDEASGDTNTEIIPVIPGTDQPAD